jgi:hypothetical protein
MFMICLRTKCNLPNFSGSSVIAIQPKDKYRFHHAATLLLYSTKRILTKAAYVSKDFQHTSYQDPVLSGARVAPTSRVRFAPCYH